MSIELLTILRNDTVSSFVTDTGRPPAWSVVRVYVELLERDLLAVKIPALSTLYK
jgi:hypothetical protein